MAETESSVPQVTEEQPQEPTEEVKTESVGETKEPSEGYARSEYAKPEFWNDRFRESPKAFDWYITWKEFKKYALLLDHPKNRANVLMVGSGNSKLSKAMTNAGYFVTNCDISDVVLESMREDSEEFVQLDASKLPYKDNSFDLVIDKGTYDALACDATSQLTNNLVAEMARVSANTVYIITHGKPEGRLPRFREAIGDEFECRDFKCELSIMAQIINIMRSKFPNKSLSNILKDKLMFTQCLVELGSYMKAKN
jgi:hypothetical protein